MSTTRYNWALLALICMAICAPRIAAQKVDYKEEVEGIAKASRVPLQLLETENFVIAYTTTAKTAKEVGKVGEKALKVWKELKGSKTLEEAWGRSREGDLKVLTFVLKSKVDMKRIAKWYDKKYKPYEGFSDVISSGSYFPQPDPRTTIFMHAMPISQKDLPGVMAHEVGHMCMHRHEYHHNFLPPWLEEGFGIWMEGKVMGKTECFCFHGSYGDNSSSGSLTGSKWSKWRARAKSLAKRGADKNLKDIYRLRMNEIGQLEATKAASVIDYMIAESPKKFCKFVAAMKGFWPKSYESTFIPEHFKAQNRALQQVFSCDTATMDDRWRKWAKGGMK